MRVVHDWIETSQVLRELLDIYTALKTNNPKKQVVLDTSVFSISIRVDGREVLLTEKNMSNELWSMKVDEKIAEVFFRSDSRLVY